MRGVNWTTKNGLVGIGFLLTVLIISGCSGISIADTAEADISEAVDEIESGQDMDEPEEEFGPKEYNVPVEDAALVNPFDSDQASVQRGKEIYEAGCNDCHGGEGRGDGPAAGRLNPAPADFQADFVRDLSDGELFFIITNGVDGSAMMAFNFYEDDQRWHLVNYIRSLQE